MDAEEMVESEPESEPPEEEHEDEPYQCHYFGVMKTAECGLQEKHLAVQKTKPKTSNLFLEYVNI